MKCCHELKGDSRTHLRHDTVNLPRTSVLAKIRCRCRCNRIPMILQSFGNDVEFATVQVICRAPTAMSDASPLLNAETVLSLAHRQPTKFEYLVVNIQSTVVSFSRNSISYDDEPTLSTREQDSESTKICRQWFDHQKAPQRHFKRALNYRALLLSCAVPDIFHPSSDFCRK